MHVENPLLSSVQLALQNATQVEAIQLIEDVTDFCIAHENGKVFYNWDRDVIKLMVAYHLAKDTIGIVSEKDGSISGVHMWYNCNYDDDWNFVLQWEPDREDNDSIFMAFLFASSPKSFKKLTEAFIKEYNRQGPKKLIGIRQRGEGTPTRVEYKEKLFKKILEIKD